MNQNIECFKKLEDAFKDLKLEDAFKDLKNTIDEAALLFDMYSKTLNEPETISLKWRIKKVLRKIKKYFRRLKK